MKQWRENTLASLMAAVFLFVPAADVLSCRVQLQQHVRQDANFTGFSLRWYDSVDARHQVGGGLLPVVAGGRHHRRAVGGAGHVCRLVLVRYRRFSGGAPFSGHGQCAARHAEVVIGLSLLLLMVGANVGWPERGILTIVLGHTLLGMAYGMVVVQSRLME